MRTVCLFSGGKDSLFAVWWALSQGFEVELLTLFPPRNSYMFHHPNVGWCALQAKRMGLRHHMQEVSGEKEEEIEELMQILSRFKIDGVVSGALASEYQKERIDGICEQLSLISFSPLWHKNQFSVLQEMVESGFEILFSSVSADGLEKNWLGRRIDAQCLHALQKLEKEKGINIAFEGGEAETFVTNAPFFSSPIKIEKSRIDWKGASGEFVIEQAK